MQINTKKNHPKKIILTVILLVIIVILVGYLVILNNSKTKPSNSINTGKPTTSEVKAGNDAKIKTDSTSDASKSTADNTDKTPEKTDAEANQNQTVPQIIITAGNQNANVIQIRTLISDITTSGNCTLILKLGSSTLTKTASIQALPDSSTCKGFDIPVSELPTKGTWVAQVTFSNANGSTQATQNIEVR